MNGPPVRRSVIPSTSGRYSNERVDGGTTAAAALAATAAAVAAAAAVWNKKI